MHLTAPKTLRRHPREKPSRRGSQPRSRPALSVSQVRARRGGGPEDRAFYTCECGFAWTGEVTAAPACPHCGTPQAW